MASYIEDILVNHSAPLLHYVYNLVCAAEPLHQKYILEIRKQQHAFYWLEYGFNYTHAFTFTVCSSIMEFNVIPVRHVTLT